MRPIRRALATLAAAAAAAAVAAALAQGAAVDSGVSGQVRGASGRGLPRSATVVVRRAATGRMVARARSGRLGRFRFALRPGGYVVEATVASTSGAARRAVTVRPHRFTVVLLRIDVPRRGGYPAGPGPRPPRPVGRGGRRNRPRVGWISSRRSYPGEGCSRPVGCAGRPAQRYTAGHPSPSAGLVAGLTSSNAGMSPGRRRVLRPGRHPCAMQGRETGYGLACGFRVHTRASMNTGVAACARP
jgi:carboxypeptidase family protein